MSGIYQRLEKCYSCVRAKTDFVPEAALVLGSGLGDYADSADVSIKDVLNYSEIEDFPVSTVAGHKGRFVFGEVNGVRTVIMQGRVHYYEGYKMEDVVLPVRLMKMMGAKKLLLTNAAGGVNTSYHAGDLMLISDHICMAPSPLIGENAEELGVRFPDMSDIYNSEMRAAIRDTARKLGIALQEGVYIQLTGPNYESPAEIRMVRTLGADAVGMSTACEAVAANHAGMKVAGISCISNMACGITDKPLTHAEVQETADRTAPIFKKLITGAITSIKDL